MDKDSDASGTYRNARRVTSATRLWLAVGRSETAIARKASFPRVAKAWQVDSGNQDQYMLLTSHLHLLSKAYHGFHIPRRGPIFAIHRLENLTNPMAGNL